MRRFFGLTVSTAVLLLLLILTLQPVLSSAGATRRAGVQAAFTGDRCADLVVGVPYESIGGTDYTGAFNVLYGADPAGLPGGGNDAWGQFSNPSEDGDEFGVTLAGGDFDGDGYVDLAAGIPFEDIEGTAVLQDAGAVEVWYGAAFGLDSDSAELWHQDVVGVQGTAEEYDWFGYGLAAGDFDGDGYADLAVGVPSEDLDVQNVGVVEVLYGTSTGLSATGDQLWGQGIGGMGGDQEADDRLGLVLAAGDFNGDGYADLAIGVPEEDLETPSAAIDVGMVHVLYGSSTGLTSAGSQMWWQSEREAYDSFGWALTSGDFDGDGYGDLAVGAPGEDAGSPEVNGAGMVTVIYGSSTGLVSAGSQSWDRGSDAEEGDSFGKALSAGDYNRDGRDDLAVGIPYADRYDVADSGAVEILYGAQDGLYRRPVYNDLWHQDRIDVEDSPEEDDYFGYSLASGDFDGDGYDDLVVGIPYEDIYDVGNNEGAAQVLYGSAYGIHADYNWFFCQGLDIEGSADPDDRFGLTLVALSQPSYRAFLPIVPNDWP